MTLLMALNPKVKVGSHGAPTNFAALLLKERITYLQASLPRLRDPSDAEGVISLAPKPSAVVGEVFRQQKPVISQGPATPISIWQLRRKSQSIDPD